MLEGNIILCGFMGSGKTSIGRRVAKKLGKRFCDLDQYIEKKLGRSVSQIFEQAGEAGFRREETEAVREIANRKDYILACGGGTVLFPQNVELLHRGGGTILYLDVPLAALQERLKNDRKRPLLQVPDRRAVIAELYEKRCPQYRRAADMAVDAGAPACVVAARIAKLASDLER